MVWFKTCRIDSFSWFNAEIKITNWTKNLIYTSYFRFILKINSSIEFRKSCHICTFNYKLIFTSMHKCSIWNYKCRWSLILLSKITSSTSSSSTTTSKVTLSSIVVTLKLFTHFIIIIFFIKINKQFIKNIHLL